MIDFAIINIWVTYEQVRRSKTSRREYMKQEAEEVYGTMPSNHSNELAESKLESPTKKRRTCSSTSKCRNRTLMLCCTCKKPSADAV